MTTENPSEELKPDVCPLCGGECTAVLWDDGWRVLCDTNHAGHRSEELAVKEWNTRTSDQEVERLREALELAVYAWFKGDGGAGSREDMGTAMDMARAALDSSPTTLTNTGAKSEVE